MIGVMNRFKTIRTRLGVTQKVIADGIGCSQANVVHYETRDQTVPPESAKRLIVFAKGLGHAVTYEDIYGPADAANDASEALAGAADTSRAGQGVERA